MAKEDFCFTYYDGDAARDMAHMNRLERGAYSDLIVSQRKFGHLRLSLIKKTLGNDFDDVWESLEIILKKDEEGKYYIEWLDNSVEKMKKQSCHQSNNGKKGGRPDLNNELITIFGDMIPRSPDKDDHFLYVFKRVSDGTYKIGETSDLFKRRLTIKVPTADLKIIHFVKIDSFKNLEYEGILKKRFNDYSITGDWFNFSENELNELIEEMNRLKKLNNPKNFQPDDKKKPLEYGYGNEDVNEDFEESEKLLIPALYKIFVEKNAGYLKNDKDDYSALQTILKYLCELLGEDKNRVFDNTAAHHALKLRWGEIVSFVVKDNFYQSFDLPGIQRNFRAIILKQKNGNKPNSSSVAGTSTARVEALKKW